MKLAPAGLVGFGVLVAMGASAEANEYRSDMTQIGVTKKLHNSYTGKSAAIGIFDGLADKGHKDFEGRLFNFTLYQGTYTIYDAHGTHVSGTAGAGNNGSGIVGVAPDARIDNYAVFDNTKWRATDNGKAAFDHAVKRKVSVVNMSYGPSGVAGDLFSNGELNLFDDYKDSMVLVRAAGNTGANAVHEYYSGDASTSLPHLLVVGSVNPNNQISSFSNRPGVNCIGPVNTCDSSDMIRNFFIVAPGNNIVSDAPGNKLASMSGTSMAAPHVAGAVALLKDAWPWLAPAKQAEILKKTAKDLGQKGVDSIYGWGLLDVAAAMSPSGKTVVATGGNVSQGGTPLLSSNIGGSASTLPCKKNALDALDGLVVFDDFGRDFGLDLGETEVEAPPPSRDLADRLGELSVALSVAPAASGHDAGSTFAFQSSTEVPSGEAFAVASFAGDGYAMRFGQGSAGLYFRATGFPGGPHLMLGLGEAGEALDQGSFADATFALGERASIGAFVASSSALVQGAAEGGLAAALSQTQARPEADLLGLQASYSVSKGVTLGFSYGRLIEQDRVLGEASTGAFALGEGSTTETFGASLSVALGDQVSAVMFYDYALLNASAAQGSLYQGAENWHGQKFGVGLSFDGPITGSDQMRIALMQPLHITSGHGIANVPVGRDLEGNVIYERRAFDIDSDAVPLELSISYLDRGETVAHGIMLSLDDSDVRDNEGINFNVVAAIKVNF